MTKIFYYTPVTETIASNGSEKFGATSVTKMWNDKDKFKMEVSSSGTTKDDALQKLIVFLTGTNIQLIEVKQEMYLCTKSVVTAMKPIFVSKPLFANDEQYYIALLNHDECEQYYIANDEPADFLTRECIEGTMDVSKITIRNAKKNGLFAMIKDTLDLTSYRNIAMCIYNIAKRENISEIELFNKLAKT